VRAQVGACPPGRPRPMTHQPVQSQRTGSGLNPMVLAFSASTDTNDRTVRSTAVHRVTARAFRGVLLVRTRPGIRTRLGGPPAVTMRPRHRTRTDAVKTRAAGRDPTHDAHVGSATRDVGVKVPGSGQAVVTGPGQAVVTAARPISSVSSAVREPCHRPTPTRMDMISAMAKAAIAAHIMIRPIVANA